MDVGGEIGAAALLAGFDEHDAARVREAGLSCGLDGEQRCVGGIAIVGAAPPVEPVAFHDRGPWPEAVAPFKVAILNLKQGDGATDAASELLYRDLTAKGIDVLYHDLDERPGSKFATTDLIGVPWQVLIGPKGLASGTFEVKRRADGSREMLSPAAATDLLSR